MIRRSRVAGSFYPDDPAVLRKEIEEIFVREFGTPPTVTPTDGKIGILCPHAGYIFSAKTKSYGYQALAERFPERIIILGPNHTGMGSPLGIMTEGEWETPLGNVIVDTEMAEAILDACDILHPDERSHQYEHSIEVQLPFLQYLSSDITFVPISMRQQDKETAQALGKALKKVIEDRSVGIIASSDLMHYGSTYGYVPFRENPIKTMEKQDREILNAVVSRNIEKIYDIVETGYTMCGYGCAATMIHALESHITEGTLLDYSTSYEVSRNTNAIVGYGSVVLR
jgi:hypothetical protein